MLFVVYYLLFVVAVFRSKLLHRTADPNIHNHVLTFYYSSCRVSRLDVRTAVAQHRSRSPACGFMKLRIGPSSLRSFVPAERIRSFLATMQTLVWTGVLPDSARRHGRWLYQMDFTLCVGGVQPLLAGVDCCRWPPVLRGNAACVGSASIHMH